MRATIAAIAVSLVPLASPAATLEERVEALEKTNRAELYHTQEEKKAEPGIQLGDRITISGLLEVNAYLDRERMRRQGTENTGDLTLSTAQLGVIGRINDYFTVNFILLSEDETLDEGGPAVEVDEASIDYARGPWSARFGRLYVPFGEFVSHFIDDPILLDLGETRETAFLASYGYGDVFTASAFVYSGDAGRVGDAQDRRRRIDDWGLAFKVIPLEGVEFGASFLSDLADSDADWPTTATHYEKRVSGWGAFGRLKFGAFDLSAEILGAVRRFQPHDLDIDDNGEGDRPLAWNVEAAWQVVPWVEVAGRVEGSQEFFDHPRLQYGADVSWGVYEGVSLSASYLRGHFAEDFGGALERRDRFVVQLAAEL